MYKTQIKSTQFLSQSQNKMISEESLVCFAAKIKILNLHHFNSSKKLFLIQTWN